ncbi:hypothetical protein AB1Y20_006616 [Prymnesium parvum]|uniref:Uncharacterized protein n=1 Tax=Prymnesium parvum TaxID=97485 RepID=A0AB34J063_PRYPA
MEGAVPDTKESMSLPSMQLFADDDGGSAWSDPMPGSATCTAPFGREGAGALIAAESGDAPSAAGEELRRGDGGGFTALFEEGATLLPTSDVVGVSSVGDAFDMAGSSTPWINETDLPGAGGVGEASAVAQRSDAGRCDEGWSVAAPSSATCAAAFPQDMEGAVPDTKESMSLPSMQLFADDDGGSAWSDPMPGSATCTAPFGHEGAGALIAAESGDAPSAAGEELRRGDGGGFTALFEEGATLLPTSDVVGVSSVGDAFDMAGSSTPWINETDLPGAGGVGEASAVAQRSDAGRCDEGWSVAAPSSATCAAAFPQDMEGAVPDTKESMSLPSMQLFADDDGGSAWSDPMPGSATCTAPFGREGAGALIAAESGDAPSAAGEELRRGDGGGFTALFEEGATLLPTSDVVGVSSVGDAFDMAGSSTPWINETDLPGAGGVGEASAVAQRSDAGRCDEGWSVAAPSSAACAAAFPQDMEGAVPDTKESMPLPSMQLFADDDGGSAWSDPMLGSATCTAPFGHEGAGALIAADAPSAASEELRASDSEGTGPVIGTGDHFFPEADFDNANTAVPLKAVDSAMGEPLLSTPERRDACLDAQEFRALDSASQAVVPSAAASVGQRSSELIADDRNATRLTRSSSRKFGPPTPSRRASDAQITSDELARSLTLVSTPCDALVQEDMYSPAIEVLIWLCCAYPGEGVVMPTLEPAVRWCDRKDRSNTKTLTVGRINGIVRDRASLRFLLQGPEGNPIVEPAHSMLQVHLYSEEKAQVFRDSLLHAQMHPKACLEQLLKQG